ncbi:MAG: hypothetical protein CM15mV49_720 [uncultured marine virus]|nr:MAG: hypothetical protein CM15mV49_720 [uncultured marine virus]
MPTPMLKKVCAGKIKDPSGVKKKDFRALNHQEKQMDFKNFNKILRSKGFLNLTRGALPEVWRGYGKKKKNYKICLNGKTQV